MGKIKLQTKEQMIKELNAFYKKASKKHPQAADKIKNGAAEKIFSPQSAFNERPEMLYQRLCMAYPGYEDEAKFTKDWADNLTEYRRAPEGNKEAVERLVLFYEMNEKSKIKKAPDIWDSYKDDPNKLLDAMIKKYGEDQRMNLIWLEEYIEQREESSSSGGDNDNSQGRENSGDDEAAARSAMDKNIADAEVWCAADPLREDAKNRLQTFYRALARDPAFAQDQPMDKVRKVPLMLLQTEGRESQLPEALIARYPSKAAEFQFLYDFADRMQRRRDGLPEVPSRKSSVQQPPSPRAGSDQGALGTTATSAVAPGGPGGSSTPVAQAPAPAPAPA
eukprot:Hpha_TRINITY_DN15899_c1_g17::TRINITY_DN15899_c1_g17_i1::g.190901::m.190901